MWVHGSANFRNYRGNIKKITKFLNSAELFVTDSEDFAGTRAAKAWEAGAGNVLGQNF
jgi:hypothetical protein